MTLNSLWPIVGIKYRQGWQVSPHHCKNRVIMAEIFSAMGEMAKTKFGESCHENTQLIETSTV